MNMARHTTTVTHDDLRRRQEALLRRLLALLAADPHVLGADPDLAAALAQTYPQLVPNELLSATRRLLVAYERVCPGYCAKAGVPYPAQKVAALHGVLDEFDRLQ